VYYLFLGAFQVYNFFCVLSFHNVPFVLIFAVFIEPINDSESLDLKESNVLVDDETLIA